MESRSIRTALPAFVLLFLLSLVELINDTTVSARNPHWRPGFWDAGTARVIVTQISSFVTVLAQVLGPILVTRLSRRSSHWSGLVAGILCLTAGGIAVFLDSTNYATQELSQDESGSVTDTLLSSRRYSHEGSSHPDDGVVSPVGLLKICLGLKAPPREKILAFTPWIFFFITISQASRPLFATFAQQRCGLSPTEVRTLLF
ncbi:hypothetical protein RAB80_014185 [Fusarium oxysporum f. sp. vasinfectum]|nr:hypothetical protein RAB80_014185 [Fusarium oxysporum f. sp. vasinfectum]